MVWEGTSRIRRLCCWERGAKGKKNTSGHEGRRSPHRRSKNPPAGDLVNEARRGGGTLGSRGGGGGTQSALVRRKKAVNLGGWSHLMRDVAAFKLRKQRKNHRIRSRKEGVVKAPRGLDPAQENRG